MSEEKDLYKIINNIIHNYNENYEEYKKNRTYPPTFADTILHYIFHYPNYLSHMIKFVIPKNMSIETYFRIDDDELISDISNKISNNNNITKGIVTYEWDHDPNYFVNYDNDDDLIEHLRSLNINHGDDDLIDHVDAANLDYEVDSDDYETEVDSDDYETEIDSDDEISRKRSFGPFNKIYNFLKRRSYKKN